jgi:DNA-binding winged helix-turn-helix (wHTH) protein
LKNRSVQGRAILAASEGEMSVSFGEFVLDPEAHRLLRGESEVRLTPKAWTLLELLVSSRPRAVSKTEIRRTLWPDAHVGDGSLTVLASELRSALGDRARESRYIRTVFGYGYAFAASASEEGPEAERHDGAAPRVVWGRRVLPLARGENVLGRAIDAPVFIDDASVSRRHAVIRIADGGVTIEDLQSKNGTWVANERVDGAVSLRDGDVVALGEVALLFRSSPREGPTATARHPRG